MQTKQCIKCRELLVLDLFPEGKNACRKCRNQNTKKWIKENKEEWNIKHRKKCSEYYQKLKELRDSILHFNPCIVCQESRIGCLDFHHIDPTKKELSVRACRSPKQVLTEISKCTVLCANCHRLFHINEVTLPVIKPLAMPPNLLTEKSQPLPPAQPPQWPVRETIPADAFCSCNTSATFSANSRHCPRCNRISLTGPHSTARTGATSP